MESLRLRAWVGVYQSASSSGVLRMVGAVCVCVCIYQFARSSGVVELMCVCVFNWSTLLREGV